MISTGFFRNKFLRSTILFTVTAAFIFGFLGRIFPYNFEVLHIFLFNLASGGFIILYYTENRENPSIRSIVFFILSNIYAVLTFLEIYQFAILISLILAVIVESIRIRRFSFFPKDFFKFDADTSEKFHNASLLCLSLALIISSVVILNNKYFNWFYYEKLRLNVFFLGYSFPGSLITMSVIFLFIKKRERKPVRPIEHILFWAINLGVILFFVFIIFNIFILEVIAGAVLFISVIMVFILFFKFGLKIQQKHFLISGIFFLLFTAITGILYMIIAKLPYYYDLYGRALIQMHASISLYGWNLSGFMVIIRWNDFPLRLNSIGTIFFHWVIIILLTLLGRQFHFLMPLPITAFFILLIIFFRGRNY